MDLFNKQANQQKYGITYDLWKGFPWTEIMILKDRNVGFGFYDDFEFAPNAAASTSAIIGSWKTILSATTTIAPINTAIGAHGVVSLAPTTTVDLAACIQAGGGKNIPFCVDPTTALGDLIFECRFRTTNVAATGMTFFLGLGTADGTAAVDTLFTTGTHVIKAFEHVGFNHCAGSQAEIVGTNGYAATTKLHTSAAKAGLIWPALNVGGTLVVDTWYKAGFRFNRTARTLTFWFNGTELTAKRVAYSTLAGANWPTSGLVPLFISKMGAAFTGSLLLDWVACGQVGAVV